MAKHDVPNNRFPGIARLLPKVSCLDFTSMDVRRFTIMPGGSYGVSYDVAMQRVVGEEASSRAEVGKALGLHISGFIEGRWGKDDPTFFVVAAICPHCEAVHRPVFMWDGSRYWIVHEDGIGFVIEDEDVDG